MKRSVFAILAAIILGAVCPTFASAQNGEQKAPTPQELAEAETARLENLLDLEPWQSFYVDSTLQHDYAALEEEYKDLQKSKVANYDVFMAVRDKWADQIDETFKKYFTPEQWSAYLKSGAARQQKQRAKRREKAAKAAAKNSK